MREYIQTEIDRLQTEYTEGENELLRLRQRIAYLEATLQRIDGGITALKQLLQQAKEDM